MPCVATTAASSTVVNAMAGIRRPDCRRTTSATSTIAISRHTPVSSSSTRTFMEPDGVMT